MMGMWSRSLARPVLGSIAVLSIQPGLVEVRADLVSNEGIGLVEVSPLVSRQFTRTFDDLIGVLRKVAPESHKLVGHDPDVGQKFVDNLAQGTVAIGQTPPDLKPPEDVARHFLGAVISSPTIDASIATNAASALRELESGNLVEAGTLTSKVVDGLRFSLPTSDPDRRLAEIELGEAIKALCSPKQR
jgi:hypothetical protein